MFYFSLVIVFYTIPKSSNPFWVDLCVHRSPERERGWGEGHLSFVSQPGLTIQITDKIFSHRILSICSIIKSSYVVSIAEQKAEIILSDA
jgi:hypothetical protein